LLAAGPVPQHNLFTEIELRALIAKKIYEKYKSSDTEMGRLFCCYAGRYFNSGLPIGRGAGLHK
jgi:hypothetical protein